MTELQPLTRKQKAMYDTIAGFLRNKYVMPSINDLRRLTGLNSPATVSKHLQALTRKGWIEKGEQGRIAKIHTRGCGLCSACGQKVVTQ